MAVEADNALRSYEYLERDNDAFGDEEFELKQGYRLDRLRLPRETSSRGNLDGLADGLLEKGVDLAELLAAQADSGNPTLDSTNEDLSVDVGNESSPEV